MVNILKKLIDKILLKFGFSRIEEVVKKEELMPEALKNQIFHIIRDSIGYVPLKNGIYYSNEELIILSKYQKIINSFCDELGKLYLEVPSWNRGNFAVIFFEYFFAEEDLKKLFLLIEIFFYVFRRETYSTGLYDNAVYRLNKRFKEHSFGYIFKLGKIVKNNSYFLQKEIVEPSLNLISNEKFAGAEKEFRQALEDYRQDNNVAALNSCGRALESTMKIICDLNKWEYDVRDNAGDLIKKIFKKNKLTEDFFNDENEALMNVLRKGVPSLRNCKSGHGSGSQEKEIPDFYVDYMIHTTATAIIFLINAYEYYKSKHP
ncbi:MAG: hypothetical protein IKN65_08240 [Clostridia bacterium]|nr:hypothetical protein [Clostridia bacterium]MBR4261417.1 hypothetical protein [Clostridia bacterium]